MRLLRPALVLTLVLAMVGAACSSAVDTAQLEDAREQAVSQPSTSGDAGEGEAAADEAVSIEGDAGGDAGDAAGASDPSDASDSPDVDADPAVAGDADPAAGEPAATAATSTCAAGPTASTAEVLTALGVDLRASSADDLAAQVNELAAELNTSTPAPEALFSLVSLVPELGDVLAGESGCFDILLSAMARLGVVTDAAAGTASAAPTEDLSSLIGRGYDLAGEELDCVIGQLEEAGNAAPDDIAVLVALSTCANA